MISSMTGYGRAESTISLGHLSVEIKSVNHRFLDSRVRLPRNLSSLEPLVLNHLKNALSRGRVEMAINLSSEADTAARPTLNLALAKIYRDVAETASEALEMPNAVSLEFILRMPDVVQVEEQTTDIEEVWEEIRPVVDQAVRNLGMMRAAEGVALAEDFRKILSEIESHLKVVDSLKGRVVEEYRDKLQNRVKALLADNAALDATRVHQEVALFAERCDVSEEIARLASHLKQFADTVSLPEPAGRRLDFLLQEMFREINTIGSKANYLEITKLVLEMKTQVERLREQAQNVE